MAAGKVPTANLTALYNNTTPGSVADPAAVDNAVQDIVQTLNDNFDKHVLDISTHASAATLAHPDGSVTRLKLADKVVGAGQLDDATVGQSHHQDNGIPERALPDNVILQRHMSDNSVGSAEIQTGAVTATKIPNGTINSQHIDASLLASAASLSTQAEFDKRGINVQKYGAKGDGIADDTVAIQSALNSLTNGGTIIFPAGTYLISATIVFPTISGFKSIRMIGDGMYTSIIRANNPMFSVVKVIGSNNAIHEIQFDANDKATYAVDIDAINGSTFTKVAAMNALVHGFFGKASGNNNGVALIQCRALSNGTILTGTATTTAGSRTVTISGIPLLSSLAKPNYYLKLSGRDPLLIDTIDSDTQVSAVIAPTVADTNVVVEIYCGAGVYVERHSDNNLWKIVGGSFVSNAESGINFKALYGMSILGCPNFDSNGLAGIIWGKRVNGGTFSGSIIQPYLENHPFKDIITESQQGLEIIEPLMADINRLWSPDSVGKDGVRLTFKNKTYKKRLQYTNSATINMTQANDKIYIRQSSAAADVTVNLPPIVNADLLDTFDIFLTTTGGKNVTFKTTDGKTINAVAGATGIIVTGNNIRVTAFYDDGGSSWSLTKSATA